MGTKILYVKTQKKLYWLLRRTLIFYLILAAELKNDFNMNPYDAFLSNKMLNGEVMATVWHINNLKVPHKDPFEIKRLICTCRLCVERT